LDSEQIRAGVERALSELLGRLSIRRPDSVLARFNREAGSDWVPVSMDVVALLAEAQEMSRVTGSAFDVTYGPVVDVWSLDPKNPRQTAPPAPDILAVARARTGMSKLQYRVENPALRKTIPDLELDLSALARGHGVDRVSAFLESLGMTDYMIEIGRAVRTQGNSPTGQPWIVAVQSPGSARRIQAVVALGDQAMATVVDSGALHEIAGRRHRHLIDPRSARLVDHNLASCTVVADNCLRADALASALMVLGPERGLQLADREGWAVFMVVRDGQGLVEKTTPLFDEVLQTAADTLAPESSTEQSSFDALFGASVMFLVALAGMFLGVLCHKHHLSEHQSEHRLPDMELERGASVDFED
jgi:thiamine biosynthesis lipoprotein